MTTMYGELKDSEAAVRSEPETQFIAHWIDSIETEADAEAYINGIITNMVEKIVFEGGDAATHIMLSRENIRMLKNLAMSLFLLIDGTKMAVPSPDELYQQLYTKILKEFDE